MDSLGDVPERTTRSEPTRRAGGAERFGREVVDRAAMTVDEETPRVSACFRVEAGIHSPGPGEHAELEVPPDPQPRITGGDPGRPRHGGAAEEHVVHGRRGHDQVRVRLLSPGRSVAYVPILIERRARKVLGAVSDGPSPGQDHDDGERK